MKNEMDADQLLMAVREVVPVGSPKRILEMTESIVDSASHRTRAELLTIRADALRLEKRLSEAVEVAEQAMEQSIRADEAGLLLDAMTVRAATALQEEVCSSGSGSRRRADPAALARP